MDPDEALRIIRDLSQFVIEAAYDENGEWIGESDLAGYAVDMADEFTALDDWISNGGFLPAEWMK